MGFLHTLVSVNQQLISPTVVEPETIQKTFNENPCTYIRNVFPTHGQKPILLVVYNCNSFRQPIVYTPERGSQLFETWIF